MLMNSINLHLSLHMPTTSGYLLMVKSVEERISGVASFSSSSILLNEETTVGLILSTTDFTICRRHVVVGTCNENANCLNLLIHNN